MLRPHRLPDIGGLLCRRSYRKNEVIEENKALLKEKYTAAKALGKQVCLLTPARMHPLHLGHLAACHTHSRFDSHDQVKHAASTEVGGQVHWPALAAPL